MLVHRVPEVLNTLINVKSRKKTRPAKPSSKDDIIQWFKEFEVSRGAGLDHNSNQVAPWFHGKVIIVIL